VRFLCFCLFRDRRVAEERRHRWSCSTLSLLIGFIRRVRLIHQIRLLASCPSVRPSLLTCQLGSHCTDFMTFDIECLYYNLSRKSKFCYNPTKLSGTSREDLFTLILLKAVHNTVGSHFATVRFTTIHFYVACRVGPGTPDLWCITVPTQASASSSFPLCMCLFFFYFSAVLLS